MPYPVPVIGTLDVTDPRDTYPTHRTNLALGGIHHVNTTAERDAISEERRQAGMLCTVKQDGGFYQLADDLITWNLLNIQSQANPHQESFVCETDIIGHHAVMVGSDGLVYATNDDVSVISRYIGITTQSAIAGGTVNVTVSGKLAEPSWSWVIGQPIFLGVNGVITQTPPNTGVLWVLAIPVSEASVLFVKREPVILI